MKTTAAIIVAGMLVGMPALAQEAGAPGAKRGEPVTSSPTAQANPVAKSAGDPVYLGKVRSSVREVLSKDLDRVFGENAAAVFMEVGPEWTRIFADPSKLKPGQTVPIAVNELIERENHNFENRIRSTLNEIIDLEFAGGSVAQFLAAVLPGDCEFNLVYTSDAARTSQLPPLTVRAARRASLIELMNVLGGRQFGSRIPGFNWRILQDELPTLVVSGGQADPERRPPEPIVLRILGASATSESARHEQEQIQNEILKAIGDGIAMRGGPSPIFKIKLNPSTGIMFVMGTPEEQELARGVERALRLEKSEPSTDAAALLRVTPELTPAPQDERPPNAAGIPKKRGKAGAAQGPAPAGGAPDAPPPPRPGDN